MDTKKLQIRVEELLRPVVEAMGFELVDLRFLADRGRTVLQILADRPGGITLDDCVSLSREISPHLEVADIIPYAYNLEVSSPGIRRPIKRAQDVDRFKGQPVMLTAQRAIDGRKRFRGTNLGLDESGRVGVETEAGPVHIAWADVMELRLDPEMPFGTIKHGAVKGRRGKT